MIDPDPLIGLIPEDDEEEAGGPEDNRWALFDEGEWLDYPLEDVLSD